MPISYQNFHCDSCENGVVTVKTKTTGRRVDYFFQDCNGCKKPFGMKRVGTLKPIVNEVKEVTSE